MRLVAGIGTGIAFVAGSDYVRSTVGTAFAQGLYGAASMASAGLALVLVPHWEGWQAPFATAAILAAAGALVLAVAPRERARPPLSPVLPSFGDRRLLRLAAMHSASFGLSVVIANWVVTLLERADDASAEAAGVAAGLTLLLGIVTPPGGRARVRTCRRAARELPRRRGRDGAAGARLEPRRGGDRGDGRRASRPGCRSQRSFTDAARLRPDAPGAAIGLVNMAAARDHPRGHAAARALVLAAGRRAARVRRRGRALGARGALRRRNDRRGGAGWIQTGDISDPGCLISVRRKAGSGRIWIQEPVRSDTR